QSVRNFGPKPFPTLLGNGTPNFFLPVGNPFRYAGNDVIDASALFAGVPAGQLPSVGFTAYGGRGDDTIFGSQAGDHLAGGSGDDVIFGGGGIDQVYGDDGVNVNLFGDTSVLGSVAFTDAEKRILAGPTLTVPNVNISV